MTPLGPMGTTPTHTCSAGGHAAGGEGSSSKHMVGTHPKTPSQRTRMAWPIIEWSLKIGRLSCPLPTWSGLMMCGFSSCTGKGICSSAANESIGDSVPLVSTMERRRSAASRLQHSAAGCVTAARRARHARSRAPLPLLMITARLQS